MIYFKYDGIERRIPFPPGAIYDLVIENPSFLYAFASDLSSANEEKVFFSENESILNAKDLYCLITDPFTMDPNSKKYLNLIYKTSESRFMTDQRRTALNEIQESIHSLLMDISFDFDMPVSFKDSLSLPELLDASDFRIVTDFSSMKMRLLSFLKSYREISKIKYVFVVDFLDMIRAEEMDAFLKELSFLRMTLINISSRAPKNPKNNVTIYVIDADLCEY